MLKNRAYYLILNLRTMARITIARSDMADEQAVEIVIKFPAFFLARRVTGNTGVPYVEEPVLYVDKDEPDQKGMVLFTDKAAAEDYRLEHFPDHKAWPLPHTESLLWFLRSIRERVEWVALDPYRPDCRVTLIRIDAILPPGG